MNYYLITAVVLLIIISLVGVIESVGDAVYYYKAWRDTPADSEMLSHGEHPGDEPIFRKCKKIQNDRMMGRGLLAFFFAIILMKSIEYLFYILTM